MVHLKPQAWIQWHSMAEWWYNSTPHSAFKMSPFQALYGYPPSFLMEVVLLLTLWIPFCKIHRFGQLLKENLELAQNRMKQQAYSKRTKRESAVGDWVYLKLQPYRQISLALRQSLKLCAKYYGPY